MKKTIKKMIHGFGFDLHRLNPTSNPTALTLAVLNFLQVDTVFDIGANVGQFAHELRSVGFGGKIISFEPLTSAHTQLSKCALNDPKWLVHPRCAVGDHEGAILINIAENCVSSSALPMLAAHSSAAEDSVYVSSESTPLIKLDSVADQHLTENSSLFLKIDTRRH